MAVTKKVTKIQMKIKLANGCSCSTFNVYPKNWKNKTANYKLSWYIKYRFYDPNYSSPKQVVIKGMNCYNNLSDKQQATEQALADELYKLKELYYNPFTAGLKKHQGEGPNSNTPFYEALLIANSKLSVSERTQQDLKFVLRSVYRATIELRLVQLPIQQATRKVVKQILEHASVSPDQFNKFRSYLMMLFSELCEMEVIEINPVRDIRKKKVVKRIRKVLSDDERVFVNEFLQKHHIAFHRFLHIFFHSGARISELMQVKACDVELKKQRYKVIIRKGRVYKEVWRLIKDIALPYWEEIISSASQEDYLFSEGLVPGEHEINSDQITKRWYRLIKKPFGIEADFYSLKHLHTTEVVDLLSSEAAAKHNEHTSTAMVVGIYDVKRIERKELAVKQLNNKFA